MKTTTFLFLCVLFTFFGCKTEEKKTEKAQETSKQLTAVAKVGLDDGRWISTDDANSRIEIKNGKFIMFAKVADKIVNTVYNSYELDEKDGIEYLTLKDDTGEMIIYGLLEYSDDTMVLSYLDRGSTLTYTKEK